jgi:protein-arginine kinase activator protein McsA
MIGFAENLDFEQAARIRDEIKKLESKELEINTYN